MSAFKRAIETEILPLFDRVNLNEYDGYIYSDCGKYLYYASGFGVIAEYHLFGECYTFEYTDTQNLKKIREDLNQVFLKNREMYFPYQDIAEKIVGEIELLEFTIEQDSDAVYYNSNDGDMVICCMYIGHYIYTTITYKGEQYFIPVDEVTRVDELNSTLTDTLALFFKALLERRTKILEELEFIHAQFLD